MTENPTTRSQKSGLPPGTPIHIGKITNAETKITVISYNEVEVTEKQLHEVSECIPYKTHPGTTWIDIEGLHDIAILQNMGKCFNLHPLVLEDIANTLQRPKVEDFVDYLYIVIKMLSYDEKTKQLVVEQISLVLMENSVISFQEGKEGDVFNPVRDQIRANQANIRQKGSDYLIYSLLDTIVDNYFLILEQLGEDIEDLEDTIVKQPDPQLLNKLYQLKRQIIHLRKAVWPLREVVSKLERISHKLIQTDTLLYLRDIYDHTIQVIDAEETYRDSLSSMLDIYLSSISNRLNAVMKVLTIISTIFMPLTFIAGIYGMNFKYMPELDSPWGYPIVLLIMLTLSLIMLAFFKKKNWI
ncbi:MAG: magnesium/cobalt transporter CorA [bacterium]